MKSKLYILALIYLSLICSCNCNRMNVIDDGSSITINCGSKPVLCYNYVTTPAPEGVTDLIARSGYIHPVYTPSSFVLTDIQPKDHYHHYGIWNPWTRVRFKANTYDLWNLKQGQGTVRATGQCTTFNDRNTAGFVASLEHIAFTPEGEMKVLDEKWKVSASCENGCYIWDFCSTLNVSVTDTLILEQYRYQGFTFRATPLWDESNTDMYSSAGLTRQEIDSSRGDWVYINGADDKGEPCGILILSNPENHNSPSPLRTWAKGPVFLNFSPPKTGEWILCPGYEYILRYRVITYNGTMNKDRACKYFNEFTNPALK